MQELYKYFATAATAGNVVWTGLNDTGRSIKLLYGEVSLTTDATAGSRQLSMGIYDASSSSIMDIHAGTTVAPGATNQQFDFLQGVYRETSFIASTLQVPFGQDWVVPPGYSLYIAIGSGAAGDSYSTDFMTRIL